MFVTNWISTTKIQKISEITNFFRHYFLSRTEVWFGEIHQDIVIRTVSPSVAIISYLRQVLTIHLMIPLFSIHRILKKRFCEPIINRWNEKNTDDKQNQYSQYNQ